MVDTALAVRVMPNLCRFYFHKFLFSLIKNIRQLTSDTGNGPKIRDRFKFPAVTTQGLTAGCETIRLRRWVIWNLCDFKMNLFHGIPQ